MIARKDTSGTAERLTILEKALSNLADSQEKHKTAVDEEIHDILVELKALKLFLSRTIPEFRKQFPEIQRKLE